MFYETYYTTVYFYGVCRPLLSYAKLQPSRALPGLTILRVCVLNDSCDFCQSRSAVVRAAGHDTFYRVVHVADSCTRQFGRPRKRCQQGQRRTVALGVGGDAMAVGQNPGYPIAQGVPHDFSRTMGSQLACASGPWG